MQAMRFLVYLVAGVSCLTGYYLQPGNATPVSGTRRAAKAINKAAPKQSSPATSTRLSAAYSLYAKNIQPKIYAHWNYPDGKNHVILTATIQPDGAYNSLSLSSIPASKEAEDKASEAFIQAQPLPALPASSPPVKLTLTFDSAADPHGDSSSNFSIKLAPLEQPVSNTPLNNDP